MARLDQPCPGSLLSPTANALKEHTGERVACPVCGAILPIGYGGRIPIHDTEPADEAADNR